MREIIFITGLLFSLFTVACQSEKEDVRPEPVKKEQVRILAYNIHHGEPLNATNGRIDLEGIAAVIREQNPDLVALQEVDVNTNRAKINQAEELAKLLGMEFYFSKSIDYQGGEYGVAILSKYPIRSTKRLELPNNANGEPRTLAIATVELPNKKLLDFASAHLDLVVQNRIDQAEKLNQLAKESTNPLIVAGDLNAAPTAAEIVLLNKEYVFACQGNGCPFTYPADKPHIAADYIILSKKANTLMSKLAYTAIMNKYSSDHLPVLGIYDLH